MAQTSSKSSWQSWGTPWTLPVVLLCCKMQAGDNHACSMLLANCGSCMQQSMKHSCCQAVLHAHHLAYLHFYLSAGCQVVAANQCGGNNSVIPGTEHRPQTAEPALPSRQLQQPAYRQTFPSPLEPPQQQGALHGWEDSSLTADAGSRQTYALSGRPQLDLHLSTSMPEVPLGSLQQAMASQPFPPCMPGSQQANLYAASQQALAAPQSGPLQLPAHVQQWLATLAHDTQQATGRSKMPDGPAGGAEHVHATVSSPGRGNAHADASAKVQEDLKQMRTELADVKERFAEAQASLLHCCFVSVSLLLLLYMCTQVHCLYTCACMYTELMHKQPAYTACTHTTSSNITAVSVYARCC